MSVNFKHIGRRIKEIRNAKELSQAELAEQIDMSVPYISLIETAAKKASLSTLILIANALGVTVDALLNGNQTNDSAEYYCDLICLLNDCNNYERRIIFEVATVTKKSLRENICLSPYFEKI
ncbi:MAG TPA: XRE family transcriptional regulator [Ruminococcaceae bacterium]|nr:XRE family transcriptional regulator [Oscillospiraceae bacterium]